jgi:hypothetical protein
MDTNAVSVSKTGLLGTTRREFREISWKPVKPVKN